MGGESSELGWAPLEGALKGARDTRFLEFGGGVVGKVPAVFGKLFPGREPLVVADPNTYRAAGEAVVGAFGAARRVGCKHHVFDEPDFYAEHRFVEMLEARLGRDGAIPVAVGSGTINDVVKLAAHRSGRQYLCVPTAASMDGYTAFGASITFRGSKQTFECPAPAGVVADLDVIRLAPREMNAWGYADLAAKVTAGADWLLADALGAEPVHTQAWGIIQSQLRSLLAEPAGIPAGDAGALGKLTEGLLLGGFAMQAAKSSRAASGAEHQFSHLWDMQHHTVDGRAPSHGLKVGIGTLAIASLHEQLLARRIEGLEVERACTAWPSLEVMIRRAHAVLGTGDLGEVAVRELTAKHLDRDGLREELTRLREVWPDLRLKLTGQLLPFNTLRGKLLAAGAAVEPEQIGISRRRLKESFWMAFCIRRRFTVLDLAVRAGLLHSSVNGIFSERGPWPLG